MYGINYINEIIGIYLCDIVFSDKLNDEIKSQVERDGIKIYGMDS